MLIQAGGGPGSTSGSGCWRTRTIRQRAAMRLTRKRAEAKHHNYMSNARDTLTQSRVRSTRRMHQPGTSVAYPDVCSGQRPLSGNGHQREGSGSHALVPSVDRGRLCLDAPRRRACAGHHARLVGHLRVPHLAGRAVDRSGLRRGGRRRQRRGSPRLLRAAGGCVPRERRSHHGVRSERVPDRGAPVHVRERRSGVRRGRRPERRVRGSPPAAWRREAVSFRGLRRGGREPHHAARPRRRRGQRLRQRRREPHRAGRAVDDGAHL